MKVVLVSLAGLAACKGGDSSAPQAAGKTGSGEHASGVSPKTGALTMATGALITIDEVHVTPVAYAENNKIEPAPGELAIEFKVTRKPGIPGGARAYALATCRVKDRAIARPPFVLGPESDLDAGGNQLTLHSTWSGHPFTDQPTLCEIAFHYQIEASHTDDIVASACFHDRALDNGPCPAGQLGLHPLGDGLLVEDAKLTVGQNGMIVDALFTPLAAIAPGAKLHGSAICDVEGKPRRVGGGMFEYPLAHVPAGATVHSRWAGVMTSDSKRCEIEFSARQDDKPDLALGTYCLEPAKATPGACVPPMPK